MCRTKVNLCRYFWLVFLVVISTSFGLVSKRHNLKMSEFIVTNIIILYNHLIASFIAIIKVNKYKKYFSNLDFYYIFG